MKAGWKTVKLEEVCAVEFGERVVRKNDAGTMYPVYGGGGATFNIDRHNRESCVVVSRFGMSERCVRFVEGKFFLNDSGLTVTSTSPEAYQGYIDLLLHAKAPEIYALGGGTAQKNLDTKSFRSLEIPLPPLAEQKRVVALLDEAFAGIDEAKANAEANQSDTEVIFQSHLENIFSNKKPHWVATKLDDVTHLITCGVAKRPKYMPAGIPFLSAKNVKSGRVIWSGHQYVSEKTHNQLTKHNKPEIGDILYTRVGSYGEAAIIDRDIELSIFVSLTLIKPKPHVLNSFLKHYLNSPTVKKLAASSISGTGVGNLNVGTVREFPILLPPLSEQKSIVSTLDNLRRETQSLGYLFEKKIYELIKLRHSLLAQAFAGKLTA